MSTCGGGFCLVFTRCQFCNLNIYRFGVLFHICKISKWELVYISHRPFRFFLHKIVYCRLMVFTSMTIIRFSEHPKEGEL